MTLATPYATFTEHSRAKLPKLLSILTVLVFILLVLGGTVRNLGAGLSCPDWPLCYGRIIPPFDIRIYAEYIHRLVAGLVSIFTVICAALIFSQKFFRAQLGRLMGFALALLLAQVILGGLTVLQLLKSEIVTLHLATGTLFFGTLVVMALRARCYAPSKLGHDRALNLKKSADNATAKSEVAPQPALSSQLLASANASEPQLKGLRFWSTTALVSLFTQMVLGALVSSHNAGLACPDFPTCLGTWWPGFVGIVGFHFTHRLGATVVTLVISTFIFKLFNLREMPETEMTSGRSSDLITASPSREPITKLGLAPFRSTHFKRLALGVLALLTLQVLLGISNIVFHLAVAVSVAHLAVAEGLFALILISRYEIYHFKLR